MVLLDFVSPASICTLGVDGFRSGYCILGERALAHTSSLFLLNALCATT